VAARALYQRGSEITAPPSAIPAELLRGLADATYDLGEAREARRVYRHALTAAHQAEDRVAALRANLNLIRTEVDIGDRAADQALITARQLIAGLEAGSDDLAIAQALIAFAEILSFAGLSLAACGETEYTLAEKLGREAIELASRTQCPLCQGDALACLGEALVAQGRTAEAATVIEQALGHYDRKGLVRLVAAARSLLAATVPA
jgi:tetratricopeptide (TPR) repeat protein